MFHCSWIRLVPVRRAKSRHDLIDSSLCIMKNKFTKKLSFMIKTKYIESGNCTSLCWIVSIQLLFCLISSGSGDDRNGEPSFSSLYSYHIPTNTWKQLRSDQQSLRSRVGHTMLFHPVFHLSWFVQSFKSYISAFQRIHCNLIITLSFIAQIRLKHGWGLAPTAYIFHV